MNTLATDASRARAPVRRHPNEHWLFPLLLIAALAV